MGVNFFRHRTAAVHAAEVEPGCDKAEPVRHRAHARRRSRSQPHRDQGQGPRIRGTRPGWPTMKLVCASLLPPQS